jgi:hypothetical protein
VRLLDKAFQLGEGGSRWFAVVISFAFLEETAGEGHEDASHALSFFVDSPVAIHAVDLALLYDAPAEFLREEELQLLEEGRQLHEGLNVELVAVVPALN